MVKASKPSRSPARAALAEAIAVHSAAIDERGRLQASRENTADFLRSAEGRLREAQAAVASARSDHAARIAEAASAGVSVATAPNMTLQNAFLDEAVAREDVDAARAALADIDVRLKVERDFMDRPVGPTDLASAKVDAAARAVLTEHLEAALPRMLADASAAYSVALRKCSALAHAATMADLPQGLMDLIEASSVTGGLVPSIRVRTNSAGQSHVEATWPEAPGNRFARLPEELAVGAEWQAAVAALAADPDAELPA